MLTAELAQNRYKFVVTLSWKVTSVLLLLSASIIMAWSWQLRNSWNDVISMESGIVTVGPSTIATKVGNPKRTGIKPQDRNQCEKIAPRSGNISMSTCGCTAGIKSFVPSKAFSYALSQKPLNISLHTPPVSTAFSPSNAILRGYSWKKLSAFSVYREITSSNRLLLRIWCGRPWWVSIESIAYFSLSSWTMKQKKIRYGICGSSG